MVATRLRYWPCTAVPVHQWGSLSLPMKYTLPEGVGAVPSGAAGPPAATGGKEPGFPSGTISTVERSAAISVCTV